MKKNQFFLFALFAIAIIGATLSPAQTTEDDSSVVTVENGIQVPISWLRSYNLGQDNNYTEAASAQAPNGLTVWQCYVAGLNPTDARSRFLAKIKVENDRPIISWAPNVDKRDYEILGKVNLEDPQWTNLGAAKTAKTDGYRFFKIKVSMTKITPPTPPPIPGGELYMVIDLTEGSAAEEYPVYMLDAVPEGGWTDEYKTNKLVLRRIEPGTFTMGSPSNEPGYDGNAPLHEVTLTKPYYIGVFEVTQKQWKLVMGSMPLTIVSLYGDLRPVDHIGYPDIRGKDQGVLWPSTQDVDASSFVGRLRQKAGRMFDLPTDAQWEYACRAGTTTALNSGKDLTDENFSEVGRYSGNVNDQKGGYPYVQHTAVGQYLPNNWGLYDMHGNVTELCLDWFSALTEFPLDETQIDPVGPLTGSVRVIRGGGYHLGETYGSSGFRTGTDGRNQMSCGGFRLACRIEE